MVRKVISAVDDILFAAKIRATAEQLDVEVRFLRNADLLLASVRENRPDLIIVDLQSQQVDAIALAKDLKSHADLREIPLLGFYSHVLAALQRVATDAGFDSVVPRSVFSRDLARILAGGSESPDC